VPSRKEAVFLLAGSRHTLAANGFRKPKNHAKLRARQRMSALSVCNAVVEAPIATPTFAFAGALETLKLSASHG